MQLKALARIVAAFAQTWVHRPATPSRMVLALTRRCNMRCVSCRTWELDRGGELTAPEVGRLCRALPALAWLDVTGGEIFIRADVDEVFDAILANTPRLGVLHFPTNGWFRDRAIRVAQRIRERRPELELLVTVSVDGPDARHDELRGTPGAFDRAIETFRRLRDIEGVGVYLGTTVSAQNRGELSALEERLREMLPDFDPRWWHWNLYQQSALFFNNADRPLHSPGLPDLVREQLARRGAPRSAVDLMEWMFLVNLESWVRKEQLGFGCQALRSSCFVSAEGTLYPCHVYDRPLADLREESFDVAKVWRSREIHDARDDVGALACGGCFTPCEAYPAIAGAPLRATAKTAARATRLFVDGLLGRARTRSMVHRNE